MEAVLFGASLLGISQIMRQKPAEEPPQFDQEGNATVRVAVPPSAAGAVTATAAVGGSNQRIASVPVMPNRFRDPTTDVVGEESLNDRLRYLPDSQPRRSQAPVVNQFFSPSMGATDNVYVKTSDISRQELQQIARPNKHHNVLPFEQMRVGPGVDTDENRAVGKQGFHYGMTRILQDDVFNHQREQRGSVVAGKPIVDKRTATPYVRKMRPDTFFSMSEDYQTAAPGRSVGTAATARTTPETRYTNRAQETFGTGAGPASSLATGVHATGSREAVRNFLDTSQRGQPVSDYGAPAYNVGMGYAVANHTSNDNQRTTTQCADNSLLPISNPGQQIFQNNERAPASTLRQFMPAYPMGNMAPAAPDAPTRGMGSDRAQPLRTTDRQLTQNNDYLGPAQSYLPVSSQQVERDAISQGRLTKPTMKQFTEFTYTGNAKTATNNPMSYDDVLSSEGYTNKTSDVPSDRMANPGRMSLRLNNDFSSFDMPEEPPNATGKNALQRASASNVYVRNDNLDVNPNRQLSEPNRLDPAILTDNELYPKIH